MSDRVLAARCGARAVELFVNGEAGGKAVGIKDNRIIDVDIEDALNAESKFDKELYNIAKILGK